MKDKIIDILKTVYDPEIPVNIYDLGLIYEIRITNHEPRITIVMTFTSPTCPMMEEILDEIKSKVGRDVEIELVWNPPWDISRMSDAARLELDLTEGGW